MNPNDSFYQDVCTTYTTPNGTDIILADRKKDIYTETQNKYMCQTGCVLMSYNSKSKKAKCNCTLEEETSELEDLNVDDLFTKNKIEENFYNTLTNSNFRVLKCYNLLFSSNISKNIGEILMSVILFTFLTLLIAFCFTGLKKVGTYISNILRFKINHQKNNVNKSNIKSKTNISKKRNEKTNKTKTSVKKKFHEPPKRTKTDNNNHNNKNKDKNKNKNVKNKKAHKTDSTQSGNFFQSNIYLNVNIAKSKNKKNTIKKSIKNTGLKKKSEKKEKNVKNGKNIYKRKSLNVNSDEKINPNKFHEKKENNNNRINKNDIRYKNLNDQELNTLEYQIAIEIDKRTYFQYYWSLLKKKHLILFTFLPNNDYNLTTVKISLFLLSFSLFFTINGFFF